MSKKPESPNKYELEALADAKMKELETLERWANEDPSYNEERAEKILSFIDRQMEIDAVTVMNAVKRAALMMDIAIYMGMASEQQSSILADTKILIQ